MNKYGVIKFQSPFEKMKNCDLQAEVTLFISIIAQAIIDASNISENIQLRKLELEAKDWLFGKSKDFYETCFRANLEPDHVVKTAKKVIRLNHLNIYNGPKAA